MRWVKRKGCDCCWDLFNDDNTLNVRITKYKETYHIAASVDDKDPVYNLAQAKKIGQNYFKAINNALMAPEYEE